MKIYDNFEIIKRKNGNYATNVLDKNQVMQEYTPNEPIVLNALAELYTNLGVCLNNEDCLNAWLQNFPDLTNAEVNGAVSEPQLSPSEQVKQGIVEMIKFFSEFDFEPNFRFLNTLSRCGKREATNYIKNYFALVNSPYSAVMPEKLKSKEFKNIMQLFFAEKTKKQINNRFRLYYGSQGTGKTTKALAESNNNCMICHNAMLPNDLMENFNFDEGKATFQPSALYLALEQGKPIVLDEINLLPFESLRFLQGILDGKGEFEYKDHTVKIADGFKIIGTMNLTVNGMTYGLPEPLVDRCEAIEKFELTADNLINAIL